MTRFTDPIRPVLPEWDVLTWLNTPAPISLASLRGRVVLLHAFQMLCPGCVASGLPQAERVRQAFPAPELAVVGLHTVFEHHAVMTVDALRAFIHEYRWSFPIGVDAPDGCGGPSRTMTRYGLRGTPSCLVLDRQGRVRLHHFGQMDDLVLGALLGRLIASPDESHRVRAAGSLRSSHAVQGDAMLCEPTGCSAHAGAR
ncbi:MAG: TlpA family protein disulfide reductase [Burkholderiaceae bacterium]|jgi:hypothetical protein|nr:TlpA family protein disulfide reductase [Burkholderiaceae bacterium]